MKLNIGNGEVRDAGDLEAFLLYDDAAIDEARHGIFAKVARQRHRRGDGAREAQRRPRSAARGAQGARHGR